MYFFKSLIVLAAAAAMVSASPSVNKRTEAAVPDDNCGNTLGDCYSNGCSPSFSYPSNTVGTCTQGTYNGCPCEKCGGGSGYVGSCSNNGCNGVSGKCTSGNYDGCPCN